MLDSKTLIHCGSHENIQYIEIEKNRSACNNEICFFPATAEKRNVYFNFVRLQYCTGTSFGIILFGIFRMLTTTTSMTFGSFLLK